MLQISDLQQNSQVNLKLFLMSQMSSEVTVFSTVHPVAQAEHSELFLILPSYFLPELPKYKWSPGADNSSPSVSLASAPFSQIIPRLL